MKGFTKKAISPVVATALLLVVAVVAVVGFQTWFNTYQSGLEAEVEGQGDNNLIIDYFEFTNSSHGVVYVRNPNDNDTTVSTSRILRDGSQNCENTSAQLVQANSVAKINLSPGTSSCSLTRTEAYDIVLVTNQGVFSETQIAR